MTRPPGFLLFGKPKWKENSVQIAKCIVEGEVWEHWAQAGLTANTGLTADT